MINARKRPVRLACLAPHPVHYFSDQLRHIASDPDIELTVFFRSDISVRRHHDPGFDTEISWDVPLLGGFRHEILPADGPTDRLSFWAPRSRGLWRHLKNGQFDYIWIHGWAHFYHLQAVLMARLLGIGVLIRDEPTLISKARGPVRRGLKRLFFLGLNMLTHRFLAIGSLNIRYYRHNGIPEHRIVLMPYTVDNRHFRSEAEAARPQREALRRGLGLPPDLPVILYASRMERRKHGDDLLAAYTRLKHPAVLLFIGEGEMRRELEAESARLGLDNVFFLGFKGQRELPAFYDLADVLVLPSMYETWGLVINEVMNTGTAVIVSDRVGCGADLVRDGVNGLVFPARDVNALARALDRLLADPEACQRMGEAGRDIIAPWDFAADLRALRMALGLDAAPRTES